MVVERNFADMIKVYNQLTLSKKGYPRQSEQGWLSWKALKAVLRVLPVDNSLSLCLSCSLSFLMSPLWIPDLPSQRPYSSMPIPYNKSLSIYLLPIQLLWLSFSWQNWRSWVFKWHRTVAALNHQQQDGCNHQNGLQSLSFAIKGDWTTGSAVLANWYGEIGSYLWHHAACIIKKKKKKSWQAEACHQLPQRKFVGLHPTFRLGRPRAHRWSGICHIVERSYSVTISICSMYYPNPSPKWHEDICQNDHVLEKRKYFDFSRTIKYRIWADSDTRKHKMASWASD